MKASLRIIQELVSWLELYTEENHGDEKDVRSFVLWLNSRLFDDGHTDPEMNESEGLNMELSFLLVMQNKHYKAYSKKVLGNSEISTAESFSFLYHLDYVDSYRKMEIINMHLLEPPSGIEVLKRLLKKELIEEFDDPDDKRAKRVRITEMGKREITNMIPKMKVVFEKMTAEMSLNEKLHVISFLRKMNDYHLHKIKES